MVDDEYERAMEEVLGNPGRVWVKVAFKPHPIPVVNSPFWLLVTTEFFYRFYRCYSRGS